MAGLSPLPQMIFWDALGRPLADGAKLYTYEAGTTTPKPTYTDQSGNTPNSNPLDLAGSPGTPIWFLGAYKIDVKDANGDSLSGYPVDNVVIYDQIDWSDLTATIPELNATDTSTVSFATTTTVIASQRGKTLLCDATGGGFTVNLLSAATATNGFEITIKKTDVSTNLVTIDGFNSETIEGRITFILYDQNDVVTLLCDGNNWRIKSAVIRGNTQVISSAYTVTISDINKTFICTATAAYAVTLLSAATAGDGFKITFKKSSDLFPVTITPAGIETIDGDSSLVLSDDYQSATIISNGSNWYIQSTTNLLAGLTGDLRFSIDTTAAAGWIPFNGGTIGDASSGASTRANSDTLNLYTKIWESVSNTWSPISGGRGTSALDDFNAHKPIKLPGTPGTVLGVVGTGSISLTLTADPTTDQLTFPANNAIFTGTPFQVTTSGTLPAPLAVATTYYAIRTSSTIFKVATSLSNALAGTAIDITTAGTGTQTATIALTARANGEIVGEESHLQTTAEISSHNHIYHTTAFTLQGGGTNFSIPNDAGGEDKHTEYTGGNTAFNIMQPTTFVNVYIKL
jgi:hypothetical protein